MAKHRPSTTLILLAGGLLAGTLDILFACLYWALKADVPASRILQSVASGLLGRSSFEGGAASAGLGLALHFLITVLMCVTYYVAARRWRLLRQRPWFAGAAYGALLYAVMNHVVVPLSAAGPGSADRLWIALSIAVHVLFVGVPCALFARMALQAGNAAAAG